MSMFNPEFVESNPEPRCAVVLALDTSGSMSGEPINELNAGLQQLAQELRQDALARLRVELALVTFGGGVQVSNFSGKTFVQPDEFNPPVLQASGDTPMGAAVMQSLHLLRERKHFYKQQGLDYYRPLLLLITYGEPTDDDWQVAAEAAREEEQNRRIHVFPIGVEGANLTKLAQFSGARQPLKLKELTLESMFSRSGCGFKAWQQEEVPPVLLPLPSWMDID